LSASAKFKVLSGLAGILLLVIVGAQNSRPIALHFLFWKAEVDGLLLFALIFGLGLLVGWLLTTRRRG
jgi:uncharacterized membrane protein YciS (DUF1049 family)